MIKYLLLFLLTGCGLNLSPTEEMRQFGVVCIGGHQYYESGSSFTSSLASSLDDNGKPVMCGHKRVDK